ncbi:MAG: pyridoxine 5'-phosphate synthase, partial [Hyphomicrobiales bacterium]
NACCLVPERRQELTTEGGLDVARIRLKDYIRRLKDAGIRVSLFVDPDERQIEASARAGADIVELHTGAYCEAVIHKPAAVKEEFARLARSASLAREAGLEVHAGHGLTFDTVSPVAALPEVVELNIGHFLIGEAIFEGLAASIQRMRQLMDKARISARGPVGA